MTKKVSRTEHFLQDVEQLCAIPLSASHKKFQLTEYPFDLQLLSTSSLYRKSRKMYLELGGIYAGRLSSMMRALSAQDLFRSEIEFTPSWTELLWFKNHYAEVATPDDQVFSFGYFNEISLYHEQNHRILWQLLPPAPTSEAAVCRYLNFAESLVVTLDLALGDELGPKLSPVFERMKVIYRTGGGDRWSKKTKLEYRQYLLAIFFSTYLLLELKNPEDILKAVDYVLPGQKRMNADAVEKSLDIDELFTRVTNPQWQQRYWKDARLKLKKIESQKQAQVFHETLNLMTDPLDFSDNEWVIIEHVLSTFGL